MFTELISNPVPGTFAPIFREIPSWGWTRMTSRFGSSPRVSPRAKSVWGVGLNWYLSRNLKWQVNYERTSFDGGAAAGADRDDEQAVLTRLQVLF